MKLEKAFLLSLIAPLMIIFSIIGLIARKDNKKIFYMPIGSVGMIIIIESAVSRKLKRHEILKKIKSSPKIK